MNMVASEISIGLASPPLAIFRRASAQAYYNHRRPHQGRAQTPPMPLAAALAWPADPAQIRRRPILGGLINDYDSAA
jgi:hypothetical protein